MSACRPFKDECFNLKEALSFKYIPPLCCKLHFNQHFMKAFYISVPFKNILLPGSRGRVPLSSDFCLLICDKVWNCVSIYSRALASYCSFIDRQSSTVLKVHHIIISLHHRSSCQNNSVLSKKAGRCFRSCRQKTSPWEAAHVLGSDWQWIIHGAREKSWALD